MMHRGKYGTGEGGTAWAKDEVGQLLLRTLTDTVC